MLRLFDEFDTIFGSSSWMESEIQQSENGIEINVPVPGFKKDEIEISVENQILKIKGTTEKPSSFKKSFTKSYRLSQSIDQEKIQARQEDGVLTILFNQSPKSLQSKKLIAIQ